MLFFLLTGIFFCPDGGMADALASGASILTDVEVRVLFWAPRPRSRFSDHAEEKVSRWRRELESS